MTEEKQWLLEDGRRDQKNRSKGLPRDTKLLKGGHVHHCHGFDVSQVCALIKIYQTLSFIVCQSYFNIVVFKNGLSHLDLECGNSFIPDPWPLISPSFEFPLGL